MNIKNVLLEDGSKSTATQIASFIGKDKKRFATLMNCYFSDTMRLSHRASWPLSFVIERQPYLINPYLAEMLKKLEDKKPKHNAIKRNTVRILQFIDIPEDLLGTVADICFRFLDDPKEAIAVRVFSMSVCFNIVKKEPELASELKLIIEDHYPHGSAGFKSRGKKVLKALDKLVDQSSSF